MSALEAVACGAKSGGAGWAQGGGGFSVVLRSNIHNDVVLCIVEI